MSEWSPRRRDPYKQDSQQTHIYTPAWFELQAHGRKLTPLPRDRWDQRIGATIVV
jgi:hypothetical protein